jgi:hypothetical protein
MAPRPASGGFLEVQQRVDGLLRPDHVVFGAGLRDRDEFPEQVRPFGRSDPRPVFFRSDFVAGLLSRQTPAAYWSSSLPRPGRQIRGVLPQVRRQPLGIRYPHPQRRDLGVLLGQLLPQPRVRRAQPGSITRRNKRIEHVCSSLQPTPQ